MVVIPIGDLIGELPDDLLNSSEFYLSKAPSLVPDALNKKINIKAVVLYMEDGDVKTTTKNETFYLNIKGAV